MCRSHQISPVTIVSNSAFDFVNTCNVSCILKAALALGIHHLALRLTIQTNALITLLELYAATQFGKASWNQPFISGSRSFPKWHVCWLIRVYVYVCIRANWERHSSAEDIIYTERAPGCNPFIDVIIYHLYFKAGLASREASGKINFPAAGVDTGMNSWGVSRTH